MVLNNNAYSVLQRIDDRLSDTKVNLRHVRKTVEFDGGAGSGAVGTVTVFTLTGRVLVKNMSIYCTETLTEAGATATISMGTPSLNVAMRAAMNATLLVAGDWWFHVAGTIGGADVARNVEGALADNGLESNENFIFTIGTQNVTNGTLIVDMWYYAITNDGLLVGD